jgi:murein L,D-transpeptidase YcbB/YkuD
MLLSSEGQPLILRISLSTHFFVLRHYHNWLPLVLLTACVASHPGEHHPGTIQPAVDRFLNRGDIQVAQMHLRAFGFDPGPIDGIYTAQTQAAIWAFQTTYGLVVSGLLDPQTREQLKVGPDSKRGD